MSEGAPAAASPAAAVPKQTRELLFAVYRFLEGGPCTEAATVLRREIEQNEVGVSSFLSRATVGRIGYVVMRSHTKQGMHGGLLPRSV